MASFRGKNGYYTILANNGGKIEEDDLIMFSSHKILSNGSVDKDLTPPILTFYFKTLDSKKSLCFQTNDEKLSIYDYKTENAFVYNGEIKSVSNNSIYSVFDVSYIGIREVEVLVIEVDVDNKIILVDSGYKLESIYYTKFTEGVEFLSLKKGDKIIVGYDFLFEEYDPSSVKAHYIDYVS